MEKGIVVNVRTKVYVHNGDTFFLRVEKSFFRCCGALQLLTQYAQRPKHLHHLLKSTTMLDASRSEKMPKKKEKIEVPSIMRTKSGS